jgi:transcription initiation factor TFIID subunit 11
MADWNEEGPMRPDHIREAYRQYKNETGLIPENNYQRRLLR